jgi:hypothetical protein
MSQESDSLLAIGIQKLFDTAIQSYKTKTS